MKIVKKNLFLVFIIFLSSCVGYENNSNTKPVKEKIYHSSKGFALVYTDNLFFDKTITHKLNSEEAHVIHSFLKKNTPIKIVNPINSKTILTKVYKKGNYPKIFSLVITNKISDDLNLDLNNPYIEIYEFKKNKTFVAKEANTFEEESKVAIKAPVDEIKVNNLSTKTVSEIIKPKNKVIYLIVISDFYYLDSANNLKKELTEKIESNKFSVKKINNKKYRLSVGPFKSFNALKSIYISLNNLGFEELNVYKE